MKRRRGNLRRLRNNRGAVLIIAYIVLFALITLSAGLALFNFNELNFARRYHQSILAFWLAESGISVFLKDPDFMEGEDKKTIAEEYGHIILKKDDSDPTKRVLTATGAVKGVKRNIQITFPVKAADVFNNTVSVKGNISISGGKTALAINDKTRLSGKIFNKAKHSNVYIEDKKEGVHPTLVSLTYPDANQNGQIDEFEDFVQYNRELLVNYPSQEILYIQGDGTYTITPSQALSSKKIIYIEGGQGGGDVIIPYSGIAQKNQNLTIISTGNVTLNQAGIPANNSQLNIIAWSGYTETAAIPGTHQGMVFTHGTANFDDIYDTSVTNGSIVANGGIRMQEIWSTKTFNYSDTRAGDAVPPGFEGLIGGGTTGYAITPDSWQEI